MSSDIAVSVRGLSKSYTIAHNAAKHTTAAEALVSRLRHPFQKTATETFWALKDVEFDIKRGDVVGIIGRNGAGKSTLLKILSRITEPTTGRIELYGRVGSLLEVGTGFHPELTGRENIYLNGAILGMSRREIARQFDAIVDFSGTKQFIDTPVKRYSSGMYVRLAFAVAAHLNPEILIVDEVLAVGDAEFQKRCLGKMQDVAKSGRTVLFVSHNLTSLLQLCNNAILLHKGCIVTQGFINDVVNHYITSEFNRTAEVYWDAANGPGDDVVKLRALRTKATDGEVKGEYFLSETIRVELEFECFQNDVRLNPSIHLINSHNNCVFASINLHDHEQGGALYSVGMYQASCIIPANLLNDGQFYISAFIVRDLGYILASATEAITITMTDEGKTRGDYTGGWIGIVRPVLTWCVERTSLN